MYGSHPAGQPRSTRSGAHTSRWRRPPQSCPCLSVARMFCERVDVQSRQRAGSTATTACAPAARQPHAPLGSMGAALARPLRALRTRRERRRRTKTASAFRAGARAARRRAPPHGVRLRRRVACTCRHRAWAVQCCGRWAAQPRHAPSPGRTFPRGWAPLICVLGFFWIPHASARRSTSGLTLDSGRGCENNTLKWACQAAESEGQGRALVSDVVSTPWQGPCLF